MPEIEIYTQDWCGFCARAKQLLDRKGAAYREIDAPNGTPERAEATARSGGSSTVPQIFIGGAHISGCDELFTFCERILCLDLLLLRILCLDF